MRPPDGKWEGPVSLLGAEQGSLLFNSPSLAETGSLDSRREAKVSLIPEEPLEV